MAIAAAWWCAYSCRLPTWLRDGPYKDLFLWMFQEHVFIRHGRLKFRAHQQLKNLPLSPDQCPVDFSDKKQLDELCQWVGLNRFVVTDDEDMEDLQNLSPIAAAVLNVADQ